MALYNTNSAPSPFGTTNATPTPDIGAQFFLVAVLLISMFLPIGHHKVGH